MKSLVILISLILSAQVFGEEPKTKSEWRQQLDKGLDNVEGEIKELEAKSSHLSQTAKKEMDSTLADLKKSGHELREKVDQKTAKAQEKADDYYARMKAALAELQKGVDSAKKKLEK